MDKENRVNQTTRRNFLKVSGTYLVASVVGGLINKSSGVVEEEENKDIYANLDAYELLPEKRKKMAKKLEKEGKSDPDSDKFRLSIIFSQGYRAEAKKLNRREFVHKEPIQLIFQNAIGDTKEVLIENDYYGQEDYQWLDNSSIKCKIPGKNWGKPDVIQEINQIFDRRYLIINVAVPMKQGTPVDSSDDLRILT